MHLKEADDTKSMGWDRLYLKGGNSELEEQAVSEKERKAKREGRNTCS